MPQYWRTPIAKNLSSVSKGEDTTHDKEVVKKAARFVLVGDDLYKKGFSCPLL